MSTHGGPAPAHREMATALPWALPLLTQLLAASAGYGNDAFLATILASQRSGASCLPLDLGLEADEFYQLAQRHFPGCLAALSPQASDAVALERGEIRQRLLELRREEWQTLRALLLQFRCRSDRSEQWMAGIVAAACLGGEHLWRDLGLNSRADLRNLLQRNFPELAARNINDMRWKKFFYKQLCEQEGGYVCRSPSCDQCVTYHECFGDET